MNKKQKADKADKADIDSLFGFGGMHPDENAKARRWANHFETPMMLVAIWIFVEWHLIAKGEISATAVTIMDWAFWAFFLIETIVLSWAADEPRRYLKRNWANVAIILLACPIWFEMLNQVGMLRGMRLVLLIGYLVHNFNIVRQILHNHHLGSTLLVAAFIITMGGLFVAAIDPAFDSPADGIWWAWVSVTTVGYGDLVPVSNEGRFFSILLILVGIVMISLITANISAYYFSKEAEKETRLEQESIRRIKKLEEHLTRLEEKIDKLTQRPPE